MEHVHRSSRGNNRVHVDMAPFEQCKSRANAQVGIDANQLRFRDVFVTALGAR
jgi:hypothetical protein